MIEYKAMNFTGSSRNTYRSLWLLPFASMVMMLLMAAEALAGTALQTYWPLAAGDNTTFHYGTNTLTLNVSSAGLNQYKVQSTSTSASANGYEIHQVSEDKVQILSGSAKGATLGFSPPVDFLTEALVQNGGTMTDTTTVTYNGILSALATYTVTVDMAGTVTVPAGTFTDCRSITFSASATIPLKGPVTLTAMTAILAPRVGIIKKLADADTGTWAELVSGTVGGVDVTKMQPVLPVTTASPFGGDYPGSVTVTLAANKAATIYYTTNGSEPTTSSPVYSGELFFDVSTTLKFFAKDSEGNSEAVKSQTYTITPVIYGECGSSAYQTFTTAPTTNLCNVTTTTPTVQYISNNSYQWFWTCTGNTGMNAACMAYTPANAQIQGDCNGDSKVDIAEVQSAINMFLGINEVRGCVDWDAVGGVTIAEVQKVINGFLGL